MAPLFVGSNSDDSRIRSDRVGLAASTSNPASAVTGDAYYNSTDNALKIYSGSDWSGAGGGGTLTGIASGAITNGQPVILQSDGTIAGVGTTGISQSFGSATVFETGFTSFGNNSDSAFDSTNNRVVIVYRDDGNSNYGTAVVGTVSGTSISFGTPVVFNSNTSNFNTVVFDSNSGKFMVLYERSGVQARVATVDPSDNSISFGSEYPADETSNFEDYSATFDSSQNSVVVFYNKVSSTFVAKAAAGQISGANITWGTPVTILNDNAYIEKRASTFDSSNNKVVCFFKDYGGNSRIKAIVGTVSGTSISFGDLVDVSEKTNGSASATGDDPQCTFDSSNNKVVVVYDLDGGDGYQDAGLGVARVGTVVGTAITFGKSYIWGRTGNSNSQIPLYLPNTGKILVAYRDSVDTSGKFLTLKVTGTNLTRSTDDVTFTSDSPNGISLVFDSNENKAVISYADSGDSSKGKAIVLQPDTASTNLTSTNFLGISNGAYSDGSTATVQIEGSIDDAQSGLTVGKRHFVQNDGSLGIRTGDFAVSAGIAISTTKIAIES